MDELNARNIAYSGIGKNLTEARMPVYYNTPGGTVALISCTSTFFTEDQAGEARPEVQGRPGLNPLKYNVEYRVTQEQLNALKDIDKQLGFDQHRQEFIQLGFGSPPDDPAIFSFEDTNFRVAEALEANFRVDDTPGVYTTPHEKNLRENLHWIKEAKSRVDVVIVSLHAHEQAETREYPAMFSQQFARRAIDEGADLVAMHGPHLLRGMEIYKRKPIFYSLGNFIGQSELVYKLPQDAYDRFNVDPSKTPSEIFYQRSEGGKKGFPGDDLYWQSVMPICHFKNGLLCSLENIPLALTRGDRPNHRGRPFIAQGEQGYKINRASYDG